MMTEENIEKLYARLPAVLQASPFTQAWELFDMNTDTYTVGGFMWTQVDPLLDHLIVPYIAVAPDYRDQVILGKIDQFLARLTKSWGCGKMFGSTTRPHWMERWGWKKSTSYLMEKEVQ